MAVAPFNWDDAVQWDGPGAIAGSEEILSADRLDRARYAEFLTNYLAAEGKQRNYVLNLNAEWGAGKTWFIKRWYMELKAHYPTVYIDAWQQDFSDDPLLTVISSIIDQLKMIAGKENPIPEGMRQRLLGLFKVGGKLALKAAIKKAGLEEDDFSLEEDDANQLVDALCNNQKERYESIQYLKQEIRQWVEGAVGLSEGELDYPAFILIDELDRCRPSYAVEMLETIKHIFDIPRVVFVLATDTEQLQHSVKAIYGEGFNAQHYLSRFFHRRFILNSDSLKNFIENELVLLSVNVDGIWPCFKKNASLTDFVTMMFEHFSLNLRLTTLVLDRLKIVLLSYSDERELNLPLLLFLISLNEVDTNFYSDVVNFRLDVDEFKLKINMYGTKLHTYIITDAECVDVEPYYISKGATDKRYIYVDHFLINSYHWMRAINHGEIDIRKIMVDILTEEGEYGFQENDWVRMILSELEDDMSIYRILVERSFYLK
ncbi:P-loop NTPase fold protein [Aeromonas veronii]